MNYYKIIQLDPIAAVRLDIQESSITHQPHVEITMENDIFFTIEDLERTIKEAKQFLQEYKDTSL